MAETLISEIRTSVAWLFQDSLDFSTVTDSSRLKYHQALANGTDSGQADRVWHDSRTLSSGTDEDLALSSLPVNLFDGSLAIALAKVKAIFLVNTATTEGEDLVVGGATADEWQGPFAAAGNKITVPADSCLLLVNKKAGWTVSAGSSDQLRIANNGAGNITYNIAVLGASA